ncbi:UDP-glucose/GDP-mannose dehydrogenase family protein [Candidatus Dependentiae bacterium]|nr:UDP-glucose/GDP-mannose dehydrogenase family protein [Candidatus Dependentiae bacterium]
MKKIAVIGAGYVGLVTAACLAQKNNIVTVIERDLQKITSLLNGKVPFYEPGLDHLIISAIQTKHLIFVNNITQALDDEPEVIFSCVGTPSQEDGSADLSYVWNAAIEIGQSLKNYALIINKSTVPVGTAQQVKKLIQAELDKRQSSVNFSVASNPEFLKEGDAVNDFLMPDRIIVGVDCERAQRLLTDLYYPFLSHGAPLVSMSIASAELTKYASNAMLATRISFMNQMALLADALGADINEVKKGMALDKRIGGAFLNAGIGYGGSCFPKDVKALVLMGTSTGQRMSLVEEVDRVNELQKQAFISRILKHYNNTIANKKIGIWGLAFKPETDDIRCAPAIDIINKLLSLGAHVIAYDPVAMSNMQALFKNAVTFTQTADDVLKQVDCLVVLTEWQEFLHVDFEKFTVLKDNVVFDGRNCYPPEQLAHYGITHVTMGRQHASCAEVNRPFAIGSKAVTASAM